jgi:16S rRNA (guanine527-N7)-methyltransferase
MSAAPAQERLDAGMRVLGLEPAGDTVDKLLAYRDLLTRWNRVHNLTAIRDPEAMLAHHLLDSLAVSRYLSGERVLDVGSGAGLPGIPLAVANPQRRFVLLDASSKRVRFLRQVVVALGLGNVEAVHERIERYRPEAPFATVTSRAFASLADFAQAACGLLADDGHMLAMKGRYPDEELQALPSGIRLHAVYELKVPGLDAQRHLIDLVRERE